MSKNEKVIKMKKCSSCKGTGKVSNEKGSVMFKSFVLIHKETGIFGVWDSKEGVEANIKTQCYEPDEFMITETTFVQQKLCYCKNRKQ